MELKTMQIDKNGKAFRNYEEMKELEKKFPQRKTYKSFVEICQKLVSKKDLKKAGLMFLYEEYALTGIMPTCEEIKATLYFGEGYYY